MSDGSWTRHFRSILGLVTSLVAHVSFDLFHAIFLPFLFNKNLRAQSSLCGASSSFWRQRNRSSLPRSERSHSSYFFQGKNPDSSEETPISTFVSLWIPLSPSQKTAASWLWRTRPAVSFHPEFPACHKYSSSSRMSDKRRTAANCPWPATSEEQVNGWYWLDLIIQRLGPGANSIKQLQVYFASSITQFYCTFKHFNAKPWPYTVAYRMHSRHQYVIFWEQFVYLASDKWCLSCGLTTLVTRHWISPCGKMSLQPQCLERVKQVVAIYNPWSELQKKRTYWSPEVSCSRLRLLCYLGQINQGI